MCAGVQNGKLPCLEISQVCVQGCRMGNYRVWRSHRYVYLGAEWATTVPGDLTGMCTGTQNRELSYLEISQVCVWGHRMGNYHVWRSQRYVYRGAEWETTICGDLTGMCTGAQNGKLPCLEISQVCVQGHRMGNYCAWRSHRYVYRGAEQETTMSGSHRYVYGGTERETTMFGDLTGMCTGAQNGKLSCLEISQVCIQGCRMENYYVWRSHRYVYPGAEWETTVFGDLTGMCTGVQNGKLPCLEISQVCVQGCRMGNYHAWRSHRYLYRGAERKTTMSGYLTGMCTGVLNGKLPCLEISQVCVQGRRMENYHVWRSHRYVYKGAVQNRKLPCLEISQVCVQGCRTGNYCAWRSHRYVYPGAAWETTVSGDLTGMCTGVQHGKLPCLEISQVCVQGCRMGNYHVWRSHRYVYRGAEWETTVPRDLTGMCTRVQNGKLPCLEISQVCVQGRRTENYHVWRSHRYVYRGAERETTVPRDLTGMCTRVQNGKLPCLEISQVCVQGRRTENYHVWRSHRYVYRGHRTGNYRA